MKAFYNLLANNLIAGVTNFTVWFAIIFFVYLESKSVFATSMISGLYLLTVASTGIWFGSIVDHNKKKRVMLISSAISLVFYIICFFVYITVPQSTFQNIANPMLWLFIVLILFGVIIGNLRNIALPTAVALLVPEENRDKANGLVGTVSGISFMITSVISGFLVGRGGMYYVLIMAIVLTCLAILHLSLLKINENKIVSSEDVELNENKSTGKIDIKGTLKAISSIPGLLALILFTTFNNFLGGVYMSLMDAYGLSLVSVEAWGLLWGFLSTAFIFGGLFIAKFGLGKNPLKTLFLANILIWCISSAFTLRSSIILLTVGMFMYLCLAPFIEASEQTIMQKVVPPERLGRVFGFAQSVEQAASPMTAFLIGPLTQFIFIPFMTDGRGADLIGGWYGTGPDRGMALVFTTVGIIGLTITTIAMRTKYYRMLSEAFKSS